jgi:putative FmdB family regulatory protein
MPTYQFRCPECGEHFEEKRSFARADDPAACPVCGGTGASKVFASAMFFSPGSAAKAMLEPKPAAKKVPVAHGPSCPCCGVRQP